MQRVNFGFALAGLTVCWALTSQAQESGPIGDANGRLCLKKAHITVDVPCRPGKSPSTPTTTAGPGLPSSDKLGARTCVSSQPQRTRPGATMFYLYNTCAAVVEIKSCAYRTVQSRWLCLSQKVEPGKYLEHKMSVPVGEWTFDARFPGESRKLISPKP